MRKWFWAIYLVWNCLSVDQAFSQTLNIPEPDLAGKCPYGCCQRYRGFAIQEIQQTFSKCVEDISGYQRLWEVPVPFSFTWNVEEDSNEEIGWYNPFLRPEWADPTDVEYSGYSEEGSIIRKSFALENYFDFLEAISLLQSDVEKTYQLAKKGLQEQISDYEQAWGSSWRLVYRNNFSDPVETAEWIEQSISRQRTFIQEALSIIPPIYIGAYNYCAKHHGIGSAFYHKGFLNFHLGFFFDALEDIMKYLESEKKIAEDTLAKLCFMQGQAQRELGLYQNAIHSLSEAIQRDPKNIQAYIERAAAYFELGDFDLSLRDFLQSGLKSTSIGEASAETLEFAKGLILGAMKGSGEGALEYLPSLLASIHGLSNGLWAVIADPLHFSADLVEACKNCVTYLKEHSSFEILEGLSPELSQLVRTWEQLTSSVQGELTGYIIGKYGVDIFMTVGVGQGMKLYKKLQEANNLFAFERLASASEHMVRDAAKAWNREHTKALKSIEAFKEKEKKVEDLQKRYLPEAQARKILHNAGFKTFRRPEGIPWDYRIQLSDRGGGMKYVHPNHTQEYVRVMPGKPYSPFPYQQQPYVIHMRDGKALDIAGKLVSGKSPEAHVPIKKFTYRPKEK